MVAKQTLHPLLDQPPADRHGIMRGGGDFIPDEDANIERRIRQALEMPRDAGMDATQRALRENDPELVRKVLERFVEMAVGYLAVHGDDTPMVEEGQPDYWADMRPLTGVEGSGVPPQGHPSVMAMNNDPQTMMGGA